MASLQPYSGTWSRRQAAHLLRRASFGATNQQIDTAVTDGLNSTLTKLFTPLAPKAPPLNPTDGSKWVPDAGQIWTKTVVVGDQANPATSTAYDLARGSGYYDNTTKVWWLHNMIHDDLSIHNKLTLFWSNHFATETQTILNAIFSFQFLAYLHANAFGNVKDMARRTTLDPAMLRYLNGNVNTKGSPNENFARELQELFTIGKGPEISQGDYSTFTEQDVRAAARVLTGWREFGQRDLIFTQGDRDLRDNEPRVPPISLDNPNVIFDGRNHDATDKQFSVRYGNKLISGKTGAQGALDELNELLDMIFDRNETSEYIITRLYRWFVNSEITSEVKSTIIVPLAAELRQSNFIVGPVLRKLLASEHFFEANIIGAQLKSPAEIVVGLLRTITTYVPPTDPSLYTRFYQAFTSSLAAQQMDLLDPSSVAGWEAFYQSPDYYKIWLTTATLPIRNGFTDFLLLQNAQLNRKPVLDTPEYAKSLKNTDDSLKLIDELNEIFFAVPFTENTRMMLAEEVLMNGGRYYEWNEIWDAFIAAPTNQVARTAVKVALDRLFKYMFRMAEFQLG